MSRNGFAKFFGKDPEPVETAVDTQDVVPEAEEAITDYEGQLAIDAYQTDTEIVVKAPIAGVKTEDLDISITDDVVTVRGQRRREGEIKDENYLCQECYWGAFSRSYILPVAVDADNARASLKDGVLTIVIPKEEKSKTRVVPVAMD